MDSQSAISSQNFTLDLGVSERQAFGTNYAKPSRLEERLQQYWAGKLILPPQPVWEGDPTDWTADPFKDNNWRFQHHSLRWLNPLRWAALGGDIDATREWVRVVKSWAKDNVPAADSESDFAWRDMVDGNRAIELSLGAPLVGADNKWFIELLAYHREWLLDPAHIVGRNHGLHQHAGLLVLGAVLQDHSAIETAVNRIFEQFTSAFDHQGVNDEGSAIYQQHNIIWWSQAWRRVKAEGITPPKDVEQRLDDAGKVLAHIALPDGQLPQIGDGSRVKVKAHLGDATDYVASAGKRGIPPKETALVLKRGYIFSRSGWGDRIPLENESHMLIRYGEDLRAHSHQDRGSLHLYANAQRWLVDSGFHSYHTAEPMNHYLRSREAHNVVSIENMSHNAAAQVELLTSSVTEEMHDFTLLERGYNNVLLYRRVVYLVDADCWIVADRAVSDAIVQITQNWLVEPGVEPQVRDNGFRLNAGTKYFGMYWLGRNVNLSLKRAEKGSVDGWVGTQWKSLERGIKLTAKSSARQPHLVTLLSPSRQSPVSVVESRLSVNDNIFLEIARGSKRWKFMLTDGVAALTQLNLGA